MGLYALKYKRTNKTFRLNGKLQMLIAEFTYGELPIVKQE